MSTDIDNQGLHASASIPRLRLAGTEVSAEDLTIRENAGVIELYDEGTSTVLRTIESYTWQQAIPVIFEAAQTGLASDSTGVKFTSQSIIPATNMLDVQTSVYLEATWTATATDSATAVELYDETAASVLTSATGNTGTDSKSTDGGSLTAGNSLVVRANVTAASATTGATCDVNKAVVYVEYTI